MYLGLLLRKSQNSYDIDGRMESFILDTHPVMALQNSISQETEKDSSIKKEYIWLLVYPLNWARRRTVEDKKFVFHLCESKSSHCSEGSGVRCTLVFITLLSWYVLTSHKTTIYRILECSSQLCWNCAGKEKAQVKLTVLLHIPEERTWKN